MPTRSDQKLRRLVIRLAGLLPDERDALLDELTPTQRVRLEALLAEQPLSGFPSASASIIAHVSPWLAERSRPGAEATTSAGQAALARCARSLFGSEDASPALPSPTLLSRAMSLVRPR